MSNIPKSIKEKIGKNIHNKENHPIQLIKEHIYKYFGHDYVKIDNLSPIVSTHDNFDSLLIRSRLWLCNRGSSSEIKIRYLLHQ